MADHPSRKVGVQRNNGNNLRIGGCSSPKWFSAAPNIRKTAPWGTKKHTETKKYKNTTKTLKTQNQKLLKN